MEIKAVKFRKDGFYSQPFAFGGEEGMDKFDKNIRYRGSLQNYLIDTGSEVILVDTGLTAGTPEGIPDENSPAFIGKDICSYMEALAALGYKPGQVTKILLTHRHADHSGELKSFPFAKIYVNQNEMDAAELQGLENLVPVSFSDGAYYNFPENQKISDGIYLIKATGHTKGNSIVIAEMEGLFYMLHGDITYVDEALYEDKLSVVYDDLPAAGGTETATPAYLLLGASVGTDVVIKGKKRLSLYIIGSNLTDQACMPHLSRLKYIGIANMGRNVSFKMIVPF